MLCEFSLSFVSHSLPSTLMCFSLSLVWSNYKSLWPTPSLKLYASICTWTCQLELNSSSTKHLQIMGDIPNLFQKFSACPSCFGMKVHNLGSTPAPWISHDITSKLLIGGPKLLGWLLQQSWLLERRQWIDWHGITFPHPITSHQRGWSGSSLPLTCSAIWCSSEIFPY